MVKKFVNEPSLAVKEMIAGFVGAFPHLYEKHPKVNAVLHRQRRTDTVALITGGGSGHEPLFAGFVGEGLADAAVCGNLYNAPDPESIYQTAKTVENGRGVIFLYGTYPGDRLNFDIAEERLNAEGIATRHVRVHDDITSAPVSRKEERRGVAGDVFLLRLVGAACDAGMDIDAIVDMANKANDQLWTIGAAITNRWDPNISGSERQEYIEYGIGLHGERGILRTQMQPVDQLVDRMYSQFMVETHLDPGTELCVLVNGLGTISIMELSIVFQRLKKLMETDGLVLYDADFNNYCASYTSNGFSITLFRVEEEWKPYLDMPCYSPYYSHKVVNISQSPRVLVPDPEPSLLPEIPKEADYVPVSLDRLKTQEMDVLLLRDMMIHVADRLIAAESELSKLDSIIGDGDHGICIENGMRNAKCRLMGISDEDMPSEIYQIIGKTMLLSAGGASGTFFGWMYLAAAESMKGKQRIRMPDFVYMWSEALAAIERRGGAHRGEKTLIDALGPAVDALKENVEAGFHKALESAAEAAEKGMLQTKNMSARFGRGKFLSDRALGCQDAGATTMAITFRSMWEFLDRAE